ncbi:MAG TPA: hypothetical protein VKV57_16950 [bacterium]|nr:hypothetical protein [bacterium]
MQKWRQALLASAFGLISVTLSLPAGMAAPPAPSAEQVLHRMLLMIAGIPRVVSADAEFRLRVGKALSAPPDCVFHGTVKVVRAHPTVRIGGRTVGLLCWIADRYVIGRGFEATERLESFLSRFKFDVLGEKIVEHDRYYLVEGQAKDPRNDPRAMIGWIDFDQGLLAEGTVRYFWGSIDTKQRYTRMQRIWMLTYQYLYSPRFNASMEILYSHILFSSQ